MNTAKPLFAEVSDNNQGPQTLCTAFAGDHRIASGPLREVARKTKMALDRGEAGPITIFEDATGKVIELDLHGTLEQVVQRLSLPEPATPAAEGVEKRGPGRPKLGVVGREVTLLPRHWEWLDEQPGGASVALRKLVETARRTHRGKDRARRSQDAVYRFMSVMAGNLPNFEEALRAFYRGNRQNFSDLIKNWPPDIRDHLKKLVATAARDKAAASDKELNSSPETSP